MDTNTRLRATPLLAFHLHEQKNDHLIQRKEKPFQLLKIKPTNKTHTLDIFRTYYIAVKISLKMSLAKAIYQINERPSEQLT